MAGETPPKEEGDKPMEVRPHHIIAWGGGVVALGEPLPAQRLHSRRAHCCKTCLYAHIAVDGGWLTAAAVRICGHVKAREKGQAEEDGGSAARGRWDVAEGAETGVCRRWPGGAPARGGAAADVR